VQKFLGMKSISLKKVLFFVLLTFVFNTLAVKASVSAAVTEDAQSTAVNFLKAQKDCNVPDMIKYSQYFHKISNQKEFYTSFCQKHPLQKAKITSLSMVNEKNALVSIEATYRDRITLRTTPMVKKDGQWKVVLGIPPSGVKEITPNNDRDTNEINKVFTDYINAIKSKDLTKMKSYLKMVDSNENKNIDQHLEAMSQGPIPEMTSYGINIISEDLAVAHVEIKYPRHSFTDNLLVCNENGKWKIIFGHPLTFSSVPVTGKQIKIK
jgi:hypothetical protein